jgi:hypothetical protein
MTPFPHWTARPKLKSTTRQYISYGRAYALLIFGLFGSAPVVEFNPAVLCSLSKRVNAACC